MKTWTLATGVEVCGKCGRPLVKAEPVLVYRFVGVTTELLRCQPCSGEQAPMNVTGQPLSDYPSHTSVPNVGDSGQFTFTRIGQIARPDFKKAAGKDE